ncbi:MAG: RibD family protein [Candidatus Limnocylindrales bacterium]
MSEAAAPLDVLLEAAEPRMGAGPVSDVRGGMPPAALARRYGGPLAIPLHAGRPTVIVNFVESLDGVVALPDGPRGGGSSISGGAEADRFVMALLRALADAVVVGAGTVRAAPAHEWTPRGVAPAWATPCATWRAQLGLAAQPTTVVVSAAGSLPAAHRGLSLQDVPVLVATTAAGARQLRPGGVSGGVRVEAVSAGDSVAPAELLGLLHRRGARLVLCEGGPHLLASLLGAGAVDELFLTLAPQLLGRSAGSERLGLVEGLAWDPAGAPWWQLRSIRRDDAHLFLRYALLGRGGAGRPRGPVPTGRTLRDPNRRAIEPAKPVRAPAQNEG